MQSWSTSFSIFFSSPTCIFLPWNGLGFPRNKSKQEILSESFHSPLSESVTAGRAGMLKNEQTCERHDIYFDSQARRAGVNTQGIELMRFWRLMAPIGSSTISCVVAFSFSEWPFDWVVISFYILPFHTSTLQVFTCKRRDFAHWAKTQPFKWLLVNKRTSLLFPKCNQFAYVLKRHQAVATLQRPSSNIPPSRTEYPDTHAHIPCAFSASRLLKHTHTHTLPDMNDKMRR